MLELELEPRSTQADPRVDAVRDCVAIERGPLVFCLEQVDNPGGLDAIVVDTSRPMTAKHRPDLLDGVTTVLTSGYRRTIPERGWWPYASADPSDGTYGGVDSPSGRGPSTDSAPPTSATELTAIPYYAWANRQDGSMRVWLPTS